MADNTDTIEATIDPGTEVQVKVTRRPTNAAARRTLERILSKDAEVRREHKRVEKVRAANLRYTKRGGRPWAVRMSKPEVVSLEPGTEGTVLATLDVIRDLDSVSRFVEVEPAK
ncbi:MAG: hypothetical protein R3336_01290 [Phycisphaeraceae bacterium]|nr:hypothetical protein [Phycisphaeraceae bacterium]